MYPSEIPRTAAFLEWDRRYGSASDYGTVNIGDHTMNTMVNRKARWCESHEQERYDRGETDVFSCLKFPSTVTEPLL